MNGRRIAVAFSGGRDSTALLHAAVSAASAHDVEVLALHVHHGLNPGADAWLAHCEAVCRRWARAGRPVTFAAARLTGKPMPGDSVEAWARSARYTALADMALAGGAAMVLLGHHRRDQAETFLLQALRGAGVAGLSGMPKRIVRQGVEWHRPWLDRPREHIEAYVRRHRLAHIEDTSNADERFARNRLRLSVWPAIASAFGYAETALSASATWCQQAAVLLHEVAAADLSEVCESAGLRRSNWLALSPARRGNALRHWLASRGGKPPPASLVVRLLEELPACRAGRWPFPGFELRLHRGLLRCEPMQASAMATAPARVCETGLAIRRAGRHELPGWAGALRVERVRDGGVPLAWLAACELRPRVGGEQFQSGIGRPPRSLKKQYQSAGVHTGERGGPLLYSGGQLVFVPGLGLDARVIGLPGQPMVALRWVPVDTRPAGTVTAG